MGLEWNLRQSTSVEGMIPPSEPLASKLKEQN